MKTTIKFSLLASLFSFASIASHAAEVDCAKLSFAIKQEVAANHSMVLQIVEKAVLANPACACEIVKASITETQADAKMIASIVEVAATAAPEQMRLIAQCAVAVAPDSLAEVQLVLAKLDPGTGDSTIASSEKGGSDKGGDVKPAAPQNVLDFPTNGEGVVSGAPAGESPFGSYAAAAGQVSGASVLQQLVGVRPVRRRPKPPATDSRLPFRP